MFLHKLAITKKTKLWRKKAYSSKYDLISDVTTDVITIKICCFPYKGKNKNQWRHYVTSEE